MLTYYIYCIIISIVLATSTISSRRGSFIVWRHKLILISIFIYLRATIFLQFYIKNSDTKNCNSLYRSYTQQLALVTYHGDMLSYLILSVKASNGLGFFYVVVPTTYRSTYYNVAKGHILQNSPISKVNVIVSDKRTKLLTTW